MMKQMLSFILIFLIIFSVITCSDSGDDGGGAGADYDETLYYTKSEIDELLSQYALQADIYSKTEVNELIASSGQFNPDLYYLKEEVGALIQTISFPTGTILAWDKTLIGELILPHGWVECNGQVINDTESPLSGKTIPDLNGQNRFLRGNTVSQGTGGSATVSHTHSLRSEGGNWLAEVCSNTANMGNLNKTTDYGAKSQDLNAASVNTLPPYYNIVWIMKIK